MTDEEEARRRRARRLRDEIARLRGDEPRDPSSPREFVERESRRKDEEEDEEDGGDSPD
jgi:hypothetical protein